MSPSSADRASAHELEAAFVAKAEEELRYADGVAEGGEAVPWSGDVFAEVFLVKGDPGPAEVAGGPALSGPDGQAARKALEALGFDPASVFASVARPEPDLEREALYARLRIQVETVDPYTVVALDRVAAEFVCAAFGLRAFRPGRPAHAHGRVFVAVDGLEESLADAGLKQRVWRQLKTLSPRPPSF